MEGHLGKIQRAMVKYRSNADIQGLGLQVLDILCPPGWIRSGLSADRLDWQHAEAGIYTTSLRNLAEVRARYIATPSLDCPWVAARPTTSVWIPLDSTMHDVIRMALRDHQVRDLPAFMSTAELTIDTVLCSQRPTASRAKRQLRLAIPHLGIPKDRTLRELFKEAINASNSSSLAPARIHACVLISGEVDASALILTAIANDDVPLLTTFVDGVGVAVPVILEEADDVNTPVVAALAAENEVLLLEAAADADVERPGPPAVLMDAVSATAEGSRMLALTARAVLDADGDELLVSARASPDSAQIEKAAAPGE